MKGGKGQKHDQSGSSDSFSSETEDEITRLLDEIPLPYKARAFVESIVDLPFFSCLGQPLGAREISLARTYLAGLSFPEAEPAGIGDWSEAITVAETLDYEPIFQEAEEMRRAALVERALERMDERGLKVALTLAVSKAGERARENAQISAGMESIYDQTAVNAAVGGLVQAAHGVMLVLLAGAEDDKPPHPFLARWRLYMRGRWPVGVTGATYSIF